MFSPDLISQPQSFAIDRERITQIFQSVAELLPIAQNGTINIAFLPDDEIAKLNKAYRSIDSTTDVLSFHYFDDFSDLESHEIAGEIIMSESKIHTQAISHEHSEREEFEILVIHGILHILGYDHENDTDYEEMWKWEKKIREKFDLTA